MDRKVPFLFSDKAKAINKSFTEMLAKKCENGRSQYIDPSNVQRYHHGQSWIAHYASFPQETENMKEVSHQLEIPMQRIVDGDFLAFEEQLNRLEEAFQRSFITGLYQTISDSTERTGNTVSAQGKSHADAFLEMLEKIEFGIDKDGNVSLPQIHVSPELGKEMLDNLSSQNEDFEHKVEMIKEDKTKLALAKEVARKARFQSDK